MSDILKTPTVHELKTWPPYFDAIDSGVKTFDVRYDDRGFRVGDRLRFREWRQAEQTYTGWVVERSVSYVLRDAEIFGVRPGFVVLGFVPVGPAIEAIRAGKSVTEALPGEQHG